MNHIKLDFKAMEQVCLAEIEEFTKIKGAQVTETKNGPLIYIDRGSKILGVAHLDSVETTTKHFYHEIIGPHELVRNAQLDDRLGAYVILHLLPKMGIDFDILLTTGEESGRSTAQFFEPQKTYKWMFEFDRAGDDVVYYQYGEQYWNKCLGKYFKFPSRGANSDIAYLEHLGCKGFNLGVGYKDYHSIWASADMHMLRDQVSRFLQFYKRHKREHFKHEEKKVTHQTYNTYGGRVGSGSHSSNHYSGNHHQYDIDGKTWDRELGYYVIWDPEAGEFVKWWENYERIAKQKKEKEEKSKETPTAQTGVLTIAQQSVARREGILCRRCEQRAVVLGSDKYRDLCSECETFAHICVSCNKGYFTLLGRAPFTNKNYVCQICKNTRKGVRLDIKCRNCELRLFIHEVEEHDTMCAQCSMDPEWIARESESWEQMKLYEATEDQIPLG